jgi:hypothetical protein
MTVPNKVVGNILRKKAQKDSYSHNMPTMYFLTEKKNVSKITNRGIKTSDRYEPVRRERTRDDEIIDDDFRKNFGKNKVVLSTLSNVRRQYYPKREVAAVQVYIPPGEGRNVNLLGYGGHGVPRGGVYTIDNSVPPKYITGVKKIRRFKMVEQK